MTPYRYKDNRLLFHQRFNWLTAYSLGAVTCSGTRLRDHAASISRFHKIAVLSLCICADAHPHP